MIEGLSAQLEVLVRGPFPLACGGAYLAGLLVGLTPCVYPVIPIIIGFFGSRKPQSGLKVFGLSVVYVVGMALVYAALGAFTALTGKLFGRVQSSPWTFFVIGNVCFLMGLSMMGLFKINIHLPPSIVRFQSTRSSGFMSSFIMGATSGLLIGPCTTPVLFVLLTLVATGQSVLGGMLLLFIFAFGMGTLLIVPGVFSAMLRRMPKSGRWVVYVEKGFGLLLAAVGEYYLIKMGEALI